MKKMALLAALMLGTAAVAQTTTGTMTDQSTTTTTTTTMPTTTDTTMSTPATDATATTSGTMTTTTDSGNMTAAPAAMGDYPRCSRTVTDHCKQSSARESDYKGGPAKHRRR